MGQVNWEGYQAQGFASWKQTVESTTPELTAY